MKRLRKNHSTGFSMVEVTLALGIVTMSVVSTLGLLSIGLEMNRDSVARTGAASVAREIIADLQMLEDWSKASPRLEITPTASAATPTTFYVTSEGNYTPAAQTSDQARIDASYRIDVSVGDTSGPRPPALHVVVSWPTGVAGKGAWPTKASSIYEAVASLSPM